MGFVNIGRLNSKSINIKSTETQPTSRQVILPSNQGTIKMVYMREHDTLKDDENLYIGVNDGSTLYWRRYFCDPDFNSRINNGTEWNTPEPVLEIKGEFIDDKSNEVWKWDDTNTFTLAFGKSIEELDVTHDIFLNPCEYGDVDTVYLELEIDGIQSVTTILIPDNIKMKLIDVSNCKNLKHLKVPNGTKVIR